MPEERSDYPGMPRWVKVSGAVVLALVLVFLALQAFGFAGEHGPGRHAPVAPEGGSGPDRDGAERFEGASPASAVSVETVVP